MCVIDDGETCEVWVETQHKARKEHRCGCCHGTIQPGDLYHRNFSVFEGHASNDKICMDCFTDRLEFSEAHGGYLPAPSGFPEMLYECVIEDQEGSKWRPMLERLQARKPQTQGTT